jgi:hypothetical protein
MRSAARFEDSPIRRGIAVAVLMAFLVLARRLLGHSPAPAATSSTWTEKVAAPDPGSNWAEDLRADRRFEWSLIAREIGAVLIIAVLIVARELLS